MPRGRRHLARHAPRASSQQHRLNAGIIVEQTLLTVRFKNGRTLGTVEEGFAATLAPGDTFFFAGLGLEVEQLTDTDDLIVRASAQARRGSRPMAARACRCRPTSPTGCGHARSTATDWPRFPDDVREWLEVQVQRARSFPSRDQLLVETFPHEGRHYMVAYSFEGWNAHQSLGMLITRRMETRGLQAARLRRQRLCARLLRTRADHRPGVAASRADILEHEFVDWVQSSNLLKRAFREVAVIGGLVERHHPGKRKTGRQVSFSTDLIYDVLRRYEPDHLLLARRLGRCAARG